MENRIAFANFSYDYPCIELTDIFRVFVRIKGMSWGSFKTNRTKVVVPTVINIGFVWIS
jgi:hypothetical protein